MIQSHLRRKIVKKTFKLLTILAILFLGTSCDKTVLESPEEHIYTTVYPIEYLANTLYGENITTTSVFPDGSNPKEYKLTAKQIDDYSKGSIFIYNGLTDEKDLARKLINNNNNIKIIDVSYGLTLEQDVEELWLSPSNFLMLCSTVKNNLIEILDSEYASETIETNYAKLQENISQLDADLRVISANVANPTLVVDSNIFKFYEKYGYEVISLEDEENLTPNSLAAIQKSFKDGEYKYILTRDDQEQNDIIKSFVNNYNAQTIPMSIMGTLKEEKRKSNEDYYTLMQENIDNIRTVVIGK